MYVRISAILFCQYYDKVEFLKNNSILLVLLLLISYNLLKFKCI